MHRKEVRKVHVGASDSFSRCWGGCEAPGACEEQGDVSGKVCKVGLHPSHPIESSYLLPAFPTPPTIVPRPAAE
ncbi:hypothetical protein E2C01_018145 [Portunus trituberculatus]|uniref:Uncharacterized protein n=1 Tax=Portunus trituberculatus TaxID=210409 RepID=A0A5B7DVD7_PORTR|nr:hypothetical protein [Portunus trituberculatus]